MTEQAQPDVDGEEEINEEALQDLAENGLNDVQEEELEEFEEHIVELHDMLDSVKQVSQQLSTEIQERAQNIEGERAQQEYMMLANTAMKAYNRVENGDSNLVRNGL